MIKNFIFASMLFVFLVSVPSCSKNPIKKYPQTFVFDRSVKECVGLYLIEEDYSVVEGSRQGGLILKFSDACVGVIKRCFCIKTPYHKKDPNTDL
ncbi:MAG: hypothetical protein ACI86M_000365 [Saprospiraceae bacterium]|jgi:hypothetical protein